MFRELRGECQFFDQTSMTPMWITEYAEASMAPYRWDPAKKFI